MAWDSGGEKKKQTYNDDSGEQTWRSTTQPGEGQQH